MNDFTKDELGILHTAIDYWISNIALKGAKISPVILTKIQSIIDNYCDHISDGYIYTNSDFTNGNPFKCEKCGGYFGE